VTLEGGGNSDASQLTRQTVPGIRSRHRERTLTESREYTWNVVLSPFFAERMMHSMFYGQAPSYISEIVTPVTYLPGRAHLRSAKNGDYNIPRRHY